MNESRESIFKTSFRAFCRAFFTVIGLIIGLIVLIIGITIFISPYTKEEKATILLAPDADGRRSPLPDTVPVILRINIHGAIGTHWLNSKTIETELLSSHEGILKNRDIKGVLLHMYTPGGIALDADSIYEQLLVYKQKYNVPIYAYVDGLCASGGMYIACAADKILSKPMGIIGSIGVIMGPAFNFSGLMEKWGITQKTFTKGKDKDMLSPYTKWTEGEADSLKAIIDYDYGRFIDIFTKARPRMNKEKLMNVYGAQVYDPPTAEKLGYIDDSNSSYAEALEALAAAAGIEKGTRYQVMQMQPPRPFFTALMSDEKPSFLTGKVKHVLELPGELSPELMNKVLFLYQPSP